MKVAQKRPYQSPIRQARADKTQMLIVNAARKLFLAQGYAETTLDAIAAEAGVATPTLYATFGSKKGILSAILHRAKFGAAYQEIVRQAKEVADPIERVRLIAKTTRQIYQSEQTEAGLLQSAGLLVPELMTLAQGSENRRFETQTMNAQMLAKSGALLRGVSESKARDVLWALTSRELYTSLVGDRSWHPDDYERWLANLLIASLLKNRI